MTVMKVKPFVCCILVASFMSAACTMPPTDTTDEKSLPTIASPLAGATVTRPTQAPQAPARQTTQVASCPQPERKALETVFPPITITDVIAFSAEGLQLIELNTNVITRIYSTTASSPDMASNLSWSPDGRRIAFVHGNAVPVICAKGYLAVADLQSGRVHVLSESARNLTRPAWSPDGARLATVDRDSGHLLIIDVSARRVVTASAASATPAPPVWFDGNRVAYLRTVRREGRPTADLVVQDPNESAFMVLARDIRANEFALSPARTQLAYYAGSLRIVDLQSGEWQAYGAEPAERPQWSPDNRSLLLKRGMAGLFVIQSGSPDVRQLDVLGLPAPAQGWFSDSRRIAILIGPEGKLPTLGVYDIATRQLQELPVTVYPPWDFAVNPQAR